MIIDQMCFVLILLPEKKTQHRISVNFHIF